MRPTPNRRVREARKAREIRDWREVQARNRERRDKPQEDES